MERAQFVASADRCGMLTAPRNLAAEERMKNPLESLGNTVGLGVVLTIVMVVLIQMIH
jgi:hypothetical protein